MKARWLCVALFAGCSAFAQKPIPSVRLEPDSDGLLTLSWASESNEIYRVLFKTNLLQSAGRVLKADLLPTPPSNVVSIQRGSIPLGFLYVDAQPVLQSNIPYDWLLPGTPVAYGGEFDPVYSSQPVFVGTFCITNEVQFDSLKEELGLAGLTLDFSTEVLIGFMGPLASSTTGSYHMDSVRETEDEVLVFYNSVSYWPLCSPAFNKPMLVIRTEHRNKPVRLVCKQSITPFMNDGERMTLFLDPDPFPDFSALPDSWPIQFGNADQ